MIDKETPITPTAYQKQYETLVANDASWESRNTLKIYYKPFRRKKKKIALLGIFIWCE